MSTPSEPQGSSSRSLRWLVILAAALIVVFALVFARFSLFGAKGAAEGPGGIASLGKPSAIPTATQANGGTGATGGTAVAGQTPVMTPIIPGYPAPNVISAQEQSYLDQVPSQYGKQENKIIYVSLTGQFIQAIENGKLIRWEYVTTGKAGLDTPLGYHQVLAKDSPLTFIPASKDPKSQFFGFPSKVQYGLYFYDGGYYVHDTWWRTIYGPGTTDWHIDYGRGERTDGSHGCVNTPLEMVAFLYQWAPIGTPVVIMP